MNVSHCALRIWWVCNPQRNHFLILYFWFWCRVKLLTFWTVFLFRIMWNQPWCVHNHATDPSIAMHVVVCILFVLCLVPVSQQHAVGSCASESQPLAENCSYNLKLNATHSMRRGAGRGKPDGPKHVPLSLGFSSASTVVASLGRGQAWTVIADTASQLGHRVQIPATPSPCHLPDEVIIPSQGFYANMIS